MALTINHQTNDISATSGSVNVSSDLTVDTNTLYVDSTNNRVGIGTSSPETNYKLDVAGWGTFTHPSGDCVLKMQTGNTTGGSFLYFGDTADEDVGVVGYVHSSDHMYFRTNAAERMRLDASGNLLVGTTSTNFTEKFKVENSASYTMQSKRTGTGSEGHIVFANANGAVGSIFTNGSATSYNTSSDHRLKENVTDVTDGITRVKQLEPKRFSFIADPDRTVDGFLAHEAQAVVPEAITGTHNEVDDDGNPVYQGIDQAKLVPLLTAALKESIAKIEALEARVTALEGN